MAACLAFRLGLLTLLAVLARPACAQHPLILPDPDSWRIQAEAVMADNDARGAAAQVPPLGPLRAPLTACSGTACARLDPVALTADEAAAIAATFPADGERDDQRAAAARAIALWEGFTGQRNGTWADHPGNQHDDDEPGQLDCVSEAVNSHSYLERLAQAGLLTHYRVGGLILRYTLLLQHVATHIVHVEDEDEDFAVDSWVGANGEPPVIEPYVDWRLQWQV